MLSPDLRLLLAERALAHGLAEHVDLLAEHAVPALAARSLGPEDYDSVGGTRFGGQGEQCRIK